MSGHRHIHIACVTGLVTLLTACTAVQATPAPSPTPEPKATPTERPTPANRVTPRPSSAPAAVDPELAFTVWQDVFAGGGVETFQDLISAIESDFYWIDSVDRISYDQTAHRMTFDVTVSFENVYLNDPQEWRNDTWTFYRDLARLVWTPFMEGFDESNDTGMNPDWPRWIPTMLLNANNGRLQAECPGPLTHGIIQREATQAEFESQCTFTP